MADQRMHITDKHMRWIRATPWAIWVAVLAFYGHAAYRLPAMPAEHDRRVPEMPEMKVADFSQVNWQRIRPSAGGARVDASAPGRYRLAGTYMAFEDGGDLAARTSARAILDDLQTKKQELVREGDQLNGVEVLRIYRERVILAVNGVEKELWMDFRGGIAARQTPGTPDGQGGLFPEAPLRPPEVLEESRFGRRVGEARWELSKQALMVYYQEIMDHPERAVTLFESMNPVRSGRDITGFQVEPAGEKELFSAMGLQDGDIIRRVNSMDMISQHRAEYFLREFAQGRLDALVLDVQREGADQKLIYLMY